MNDKNRYPKVISDKKIVKSVVVDASIDTVWDAWATVEGLKTFFCKDAKVEIKTGGPYEIYFSIDAPHGQRGSEGCRVLSFLPKQMLSFEWNSPPELGEIRGVYHQVVVMFDKISDNQTKVTLTDHGFGVEDAWQSVIDYFEPAWDYVLDSLKKNYSI